MFLTPKFGINMNPAMNVPKILPIVDNDDTLPDSFPISSSCLSFNFTAYGDTVANTKLGIPNTTADDTNAEITSFERFLKYFLLILFLILVLNL